MTAGVIDGKATAEQIKDELARRVAALKAAGVHPGLGTILVGEDPASQIYVRGKHRDCEQVGLASVRVELPQTASAGRIAEAIEGLNQDGACTGFIVQLPLPPGVDENAMLALVQPDKDADGLSPANLGRLVLGTPAPLPCTPRGIVELLRRYDVPLKGAEVVVIGRGITVGRPLAVLLARKSVNATVRQCHTGTRDLAAHVRQADVVIAAAGLPGLVTADMVKPGAVLVDVGVTRVDGKPVGDLDAGVWEVASLVTPNPGGVGPMTRAMLLANVVEAAERSAGLAL